LLTGFIDPESTLPIVLEKLNEAGLDKVIAEEQQQLDAWLKSQKK
jgi:putative aldouronate transport system substrate-binding protein